MIKSMTGYGRETLYVNDTLITVEMRSVNHRYLDTTVKLPETLLFLEEQIKRVIKETFIRGRVDVFIQVEGNQLTSRTLNVDWDLMDQYIHQVKKAQKRYGLTGEITPSELLSMSDLFDIQAKDTIPDDLSSHILDAVSQVATQVSKTRQVEGANLLADMNKILENITQLVSSIQTHQYVVLEDYKKRIDDRIKGHLEGQSVIDQTQLMTDIALLAEKGDITEEITRLWSHLSHLNQTLKEDGAVGRTLDFIAQEIQRETNTIGAKSLDGELSKYVVMLKGENEKIREQAQNIE